MNTRTRAGLILAASAAVLVHTPVMATDFIKQANTTALNLPASWTNFGDDDGIPDGDDVLIWDSTVAAVNARTGGTLSGLGGDLSVLGVAVTNVSGTRNVSNVAIGFQNPSSANTLTIGAGGIDLSVATHALYMESRLAFSANQTWTITNANTAASATGFNNGEDLALRALSGSTTSASTPFNLGGFTVNTTGNGAVTVSSGYAITNGTINVGNSLFLIGGGDSRLVTVGPDVNLNVAAGAILHFQSNSAGVTSAASIGLDGGTLKLVNNNGGNQVTLTGTTTVNSPSTLLVGNNVGNGSVASTNGVLFNANLAGAANLAVTNNASTASVLILGGNNSGYSGTLTFGGTAGRISRLTTANSGSAAATWNISTGHNLQVNGVVVELGTLTGAGSVAANTGASTIRVGAGNFTGTIVNGTSTMGLTKVGAGTLTLSGGNTYTGPTSVEAGTLLVAPAALGATAVTVANGAAFGVQSSAPGTLAIPSVLLADGGTLLIRSLAAGSSATISQVNAGTATGGIITLDTTNTGNPTTAPLIATNFNPVTGTLIRIMGTNLSTGTFPAIAYTAIGGGGFPALNLDLPFRVTGNLVNGASTVDVTITGVAKPAWRGTLNGNWDIDTTGNGSAGTANWFATAGPQTYVENPGLGSDQVIFDDTATGTTSVNMTTTVAPALVTVNNSTADYTFTGSGNITGTASLVKTGSKTLTIANTGSNDYSGTTTVSDGVLRVGDGTNPGAGSIGAGTVTLNSPGTLELNRPDDFTLANTLAGNGTLAKSQASAATISTAQTFGGNVNLNAGALRFTAGATLSGAVSGSGELQSGGGILIIEGATPNTNTGLTTVSAGTLRLNKSGGASAVGGDIEITGSAVLAILAPEQIPDTATINFTGTSADSTAGSTSMETVANVICNPSVDTGQFQMRNGFTITNTGTLNRGVLGVSSGSTGTANAIVMTGGILRIAGNSAASTLNVGAGGITASGGEIQVKFNTNNQNAELNLGGNFVATGNVAVTNGNYTGASVNAINLTGTREFNIAEGTATTVAPDIAGPGGLVKTGKGLLAMTSLSDGTYTGETVIQEGTLAIGATLSGTSSITVKQDATFDVSFANYILGSGQTLRGNGSVLGSMSMGAGAILAPGESAGTLTFVGTLNLDVNVSPAAAGTLAFELGPTGASDKVMFASGTLSIGSGALDFGDFSFTALPGLEAGEYTLFDGLSPIVGTLDANPANLTGTFGAGFTGTIGFGDGGNDLVLTVVPEPGSTVLLLGGLACMASSRRSRSRVSYARRHSLRRG